MNEESTTNTKKIRLKDVPVDINEIKMRLDDFDYIFNLNEGIWKFSG